MNCPSCSHVMESHTFEAIYGREVTIDLCHRCRAFWFDGHESLQLTPGSVLEIFERIHEHAGDARGAIAESPECPTCRARLVQVVDRRGNTRFTYAECTKRHGRLITFYHFLREKSFIRALEPAELAHLRATVQTVECSNCGAPVNLETDDACPFCRSPLAILDPDQVARMLETLQHDERERTTIDPKLPMELIVARLKTEHAFADMSSEPRTTFGRSTRKRGLLEAGIDALLGAIDQARRSA